MNIFEYILAPFLFIIKQLFLLGYAITGNYGASIVFLSFVISLLLLPVFVLIEKAKKKDDIIKLKMKPLIDEIKRCFRGQERHYYIKTLNRQHNYSAFRSLIPTLSLVLQIPFFIAAYQFLESFEPLSGVSFLFIKDLNTPDGLLGAINILPIAMTLINLVTAYFYTRNGNVAELKQMVVVAIIFLVLLFKLPAGLVLYWTMNNVFSFFRLFITNREVFRKNEKRIILRKQRINELKLRISPTVPKLKLSFLLVLGVGFVFQFNTAINNGFDSLGAGLIHVLGISLVATLSVAVLTVVHKREASLRGVKGKELFITLWPNFKPMFLVFSLVIIGSQINWAILFGFHSIVQRMVVSIILSSAITIILALVVLFYQGQFSISADKYRLKLSSLEKSYKLAFILLLIILISVQIAGALIYHQSDLLIKLLASFVIAWLVVVLAANRKTVLNKELFARIRKVYHQILNSPIFFFSTVFLSVYFFLAGKYYFTGANSSINIVGLVITLLGQSIGFYNFSRYRKQRPNKWSGLTLLLLIILSAIQLFILLILIFDVNQLNKFLINGVDGNSISILNLILPGLLFVLITIPSFIRLSGINIGVPKNPLGFIFGLSLFYLLSLVFFWNPIIVYASFPETFSFPAIDIFTRNLPLFGALFAGSLILYYFLPQKIKYILSILFLTITVVFFVNSFIIPLKVGTLQTGKYMKASNMAMQFGFYLAEGIALIVVFGAVKWLLHHKFEQLRLSLIVLTLILVLQGMFTSIRSGDFFVKKDSDLNLPSSISFSKEKKNVIYIIPDMFMGMYMQDIIEELPELIADFEGFVWYPNTLSVSTNTCPSISSLFAGESYNLDILNKDDSRTMADKITEASELFSAKAKSKGYNLTSTKMVYSKIDKNTYDAYLPPWHADWNKWNKDLNIGGAKELDFTILWKNALFYGSPLFIKPKIYNNGNWIQVEDETNKNSSLSRECNFVRLLTHISDTLSQKGNFIYIHSKSTHGPWRIVNRDGELIMNVPPYENQKWFLHQFAKWMRWMKENGVYDNTKIVMVADHSHYLPDEKISDFGGAYKWDSLGQQKLSAREYWSVNSLLMVKDFNTRGELKTDWRLMSNADAPAIAFDEDDPTKTEQTESRTVPVFFVGNLPRSTSKKYLPIYNQFLVKDNIYNPENWTAVE